MNTRIHKILAIMVTLTVLAGLFVFAVPVSADNLTWSAITAPRTTGNIIVGAAQDVSAVAISPNFATDKTVFAGSKDVTGASLLVYRSANGGYTWAVQSSPATLAGAGIVALVVSPNYATDKTVFVATDTTVYRSTDGGATFSQIGTVNAVAGTVVISSMDVAPNYDGVGVIVVGLADTGVGVAPLTNNVQGWGISGALNWTGIGTAAAADISAVKFSPAYPVDATLLAISSAAGAAPQLRVKVGITATTAWDATVAASAGFATLVQDVGAAVNGLISASIAIPSDYNASVSTTRRLYVSIVSAGGYAAGTTLDNVYRLTGAGATVNVGALNPSVQIGDIVYSGTYGAGILIGGFYDAAGATGAQVYRTSNPADAAASVIWNAASNPPTGTTAALTVGITKLAIDPNFATSKLVVAGTNGFDSAFAVSTDGSASIFNETGLVDNGTTAGVTNPVTVISDVVLSPAYATDKTLYIVTNDASGGTPDTSLWKTTDNGATWARLFAANFTTAGTGKIVLSPAFATDSTLWVGDVGGTAIQYSADKGNTWAARISTVTIADMAATDANTIYVANSGGVTVAKSTNNAWTWTTKSTASAAGALASIVASGSTVLVGDNAGGVFRSDDASVTWAQVGTALAVGGNVFVAVDGDYMFAMTSANGHVYRFQKGVSTAWAQVSGALTAPAPAATAAGVVITADKTAYALNPAALATQVERSINPEASATSVAFEWIPALTATAASTMDAVAGGSNIIVVGISAATGISLSSYLDTLSAGSPGPTLLSPADKAVVTTPNTITFSVDNSVNTKVTTWTINYSSDPNFINNVLVTAQVPAATQVTVVNLPNDVAVYWRARATAPLTGPWSAVRQLVSQLTVVPNFPTQVQPSGSTAINTPVRPVFNWNPRLNATGYEFQISKDAAFTAANLVVDLTGSKALGNVTSYVPDKDLDFGTAYFWKVRAIGADGAKTDWSPGVGFTVMAKPAPPASPVPQPTTIITIPPQPTQTIVLPTPTQVTTQVTPGWIYAIIAIGAILVIAVITLIVRTRRTS